MLYIIRNLKAERLFGGVLNQKNMKENLVTNYVKSSFVELSKVTWPTKNQAIKLTMIVLGFCLVVAIVLGTVDYLFNQGLTQLLKLTF